MSRNQPNTLDRYQSDLFAMGRQYIRPVMWRINKAPTRAAFYRSLSKYPVPVPPSKQTGAKARRLRRMTAVGAP